MKEMHMDSTLLGSLSVLGVATVLMFFVFASPSLVYSSPADEEDNEREETNTTENSTNGTGFTESQKFGMIMQMVKSLPEICEAKDEVSDNAELWQEACATWEKYYR